MFPVYNLPSVSNHRVDISKESLFTSSYVACLKGDLKQVKLLLNRDSTLLSQCDDEGQTLLYACVESNELEILQWLNNYNHLALKKVRNDGKTLMHIAAIKGHVELVKWLNDKDPSFIHQADKNHYTPLHYAVSGDPKPEIVKLLLANGANPNGENNYGYTPLHLAAKHGHAISAEILLNAKTHILNVNNAPPFDLAVRYGQEDFLRYFLNAPPKSNKDLLPKDIVGHYHKRLLEAKKNEQLQEQILNLQILSYHFVEQKDFIIASKILNCSLALIMKFPERAHIKIFEQYIFHRLELIETLFLQSKGITKTLKYPFICYRIQLKKIRDVNRDVEIQTTLENLTIEFKNLLDALISDIQKVMGKPPVSWACMGLGSMSRDEMCPYSDLEFAFLLEKETEEAMDYFRTLSQILELRIINLGETKFPIFGEQSPSPTPNGFCLDTGGNTPLGGAYELIGTPKTLAQFQTITWMDRSIILPNAMSHVCFIAGIESLITDYNKEKAKVHDLIDKKAKSVDKNRNVLSLRLLKGHIEEFSPNLSKEKENTSAFGIKKELYRPFQEIIGSLALFYQIKAKTTFTRIDELVDLGIFSFKGGENLKKAIAHVLKLRLQAHLFYQNEEEFLCHPEEGKPFDPHLMYLNQETIEILREIYRILIPFHRCAEEFLISQSKSIFQNSLFYDEHSQDRGFKFDENLQFAKAQEAHQQAVALNPNDVKALLHLGLIEGKMGKEQDALPRCFKALDIAKTKHGENHPDVAASYNNIGSIYLRLGDNEKALEFHEKALNIQLQVLEENDSDIPTSYNNIGVVYFVRGDYKKTLKYYQKALKIRLQFLGENHPHIATSYYTIGGVYDDLGNYEKALEHYHKALKIRLKVLEENHPDVASSFNSLGVIHRGLGEYKKSLEYLQKALKMRLQVLGENHPDVAISYNCIGFVYRELGDYGKALDYFQKALKMRLEIRGENHPDVATSYNNIGDVYTDLVDYEIALGYYQKALKIRQQTHGKKHLYVATSYDGFGGIYGNFGEYEKALEYFQKALKIKLQVQGENHPDVATSYNYFGVVYKDFGDNEKALEYHQKALKIRLQAFGENHPDVARSYNHIGAICYYLRGYKQAFEYYQKALKIRLQVLGENHPDVATNYNNIGAIYYDLGDFKRALKFFQKDLKIKLKFLGENHPDVAASCRNIGFIYKNLEYYEKALNYFKLSFEMLCKKYKKSHPDILTTLSLVIIVAKRLSISQLINLRPTYDLCVQTLGAENDQVKEFWQLIS